MVSTSLSTSFFFFFFCLFSMFQPVKFITRGELSIVIYMPFKIHPQKAQIQHYAKAKLSGVFAFAAPTV